MKIAHIALWTNQLEEMKTFYETYLGGRSNDKYINTNKGFESYFISFSDDGVSLEIMQRTDINKRMDEALLGFCHLAFWVSNKQALIDKTEQLREQGVKIIGEPRLTGDGFYESVILDIDGNQIELVAEKL